METLFTFENILRAYLDARKNKRNTINVLAFEYELEINLTSQFFANIYLDELVRFVKHWLKARFYLRYVDDFILLNHDKSLLYSQMSVIRDFLKARLGLILHEKKTIIEPIHFGIRFVGYLHKYGKRIALQKHINSTMECLRKNL